MEERLQKIIAASGVASRRKAEELILSGVVTVNGKVVTELGTKADPDRDHIKVRGKLINPKLTQKEKVYLLLNKPLGYLSSTADPGKRPLVTDLVGEFRDHVHPVGRLDFNSEGLLLLSNDGDFTNLIAHAASKVPKRYEVKVKGQPSESQVDRLRRGITVEGRKTAPAEIRLIEQSATNAWYEVILYEGRNQQIRKMFDAIGHSVIKLRRIGIGFISLEKEKLRIGEFRPLRAAEVQRFFRGASPDKKAKLMRS
ncbi:MAG: rRNA pseudouridine synthase [Acidobacteria bacterium]|nr:rRNA pseudouridine synthase [Acidobacteriota bacterium]